MRIREIQVGELEGLYTEALLRDFPKAELKPKELFHELLQRDCYKGFSMEDENGEREAYALCLQGEHALLIDYLAVEPALRGSGKGTEAIGLIREEYPSVQSIYLEVEPIRTARNEEETEIRRRRIRFYERLGFSMTEYSISLFGVEFDLMSNAADRFRSSQEEKEAITEIYRRMIPEKDFASVFHFIESAEPEDKLREREEPSKSPSFFRIWIERRKEERRTGGWVVKLRDFFTAFLVSFTLLYLIGELIWSPVGYMLRSDVSLWLPVFWGIILILVVVLQFVAYLKANGTGRMGALYGKAITMAIIIFFIGSFMVNALGSAKNVAVLKENHASYTLCRIGDEDSCLVLRYRNKGLCFMEKTASEIRNYKGNHVGSMPLLTLWEKEKAIK